MNLSLRELCERLGADIPVGAGERTISGFGSLADARPGDLAFLGDSRYHGQLAHTRAGAVLVEPGFEAEQGEHEVALIAVEKPSSAFGELLAEFGPKRPGRRRHQHPSAVLHPDAELAADVAIGPCAVVEAGAVIGSGAVIGPGCMVGEGARIGAGTELVANVTIADGCVIGARCLLHPGVVVGADGFGFEFRDGRHVKVPQVGNVIIGNDVEIGANSCVDRARFGATRIGDGTKIDNLVQIGHNCDLGQHNIVCGLVGMAGSTQTGAYVTLAAQAGVAGHLRLGDQVTIAGRGGVTKSLPQPGVYAGFPIQEARQWKRREAASARVTELRRQLAKLQRRVEELESGNEAG